MAGIDDLPTKTFTAALGDANTDQLPEGAVSLYFSGAERTKLSGIETGAEVNPSAADIKTAYESNSDTNAFTDAEQSKLSGIETSAEVNNISDTDATDLTDGGETTLHVHASVSLQSAPSTPTSTGTAGMIAVDSTYIYLCTATDTWKRIEFDGTWI